MARFISTIPTAAALALALYASPAVVRAQDSPPGPPAPMQVTPPVGPAKGGTETLAQIEARDRQVQAEIEAGIRPRPPRIRILPTEVEDEEERGRNVTRIPQRAGETFVAPPFLGAAGRQKTGGYPNLSPVVASARATSKNDGGAGNLTGPASNAPQSLSTGFVTINLNDTFALNSGSIPPDTNGAIGPNHFVEAINGAFAIYNKTTGARISVVTCDAFFVVPGTSYPRGGTFDQRIVFDRLSGRWFATTMEVGTTPNNPTNNDIILAVSTSSDPTQPWTKYVIPFGSVGAFTDYSTLGVDSNGVYFAGTLFGNSTTVKLVVTPKAALVAASPSLGTVYTLPGVTSFYGTPHPPQNYTAVSSTTAGFFLGAAPSFGNLRYHAVTWSGASPNVPAISSTSGLVTTPAFPGQPPLAPASGSSIAINTGDLRLQQTIIRGSRMWACRNVGVDATGSGATANRSAAEWLEMSISGSTLSLLQSGRVFDNAASNPRNYFYPSLVVNGQGHVAMGYSGVRSDEFVGAYTSGRLATDATGTMQSILQLQTGGSSYTQSDGSRNRWGDYSYTSLDPNDDMTIWTNQEYATTSANIWGTRVNSLRSPAPTVTAGSDSRLVPGRTNQSFTVTGTGFYDPGTGFTNRIAAAFTGSGISNVRVTYSSPTSLIVTVDVAANAPVGAQSITVTNPDGLSGTLAGAISVGAAAPSLFVTPGTLTRSGADLFMNVRVTNNGGASATSVTLSSVTIQVGAGAVVSATSLPSVGTVASGASVTVQVRFPSASVGTGAAIYKVKGAYTGGAVSGTGRVTVP